MGASAKAKAKAKTKKKKPALHAVCAKAKAKPKAGDIVGSGALDGRPPVSTNPTAYRCGKIYTTMARKSLRCYLRQGDRVEKTFPFDPCSAASLQRAWDHACEAIDADPRPR